jgi:hypothetical protein
VRNRAHPVCELVEPERLVCPAREAQQGERDLDNPQEQVHFSSPFIAFVGVN